MKTTRIVNHSLILQAFSRLPFLEKNRNCEGTKPLQKTDPQKVIVSVHIPSDKPNRISGNCPESARSPL